MLVPECYLFTGLKADMCQMALLLPAVVMHVRTFTSMLSIERRLGLEFKNKDLLRMVCEAKSNYNCYDCVDIIKFIVLFGFSSSSMYYIVCAGLNYHTHTSHS